MTEGRRYKARRELLERLNEDIAELQAQLVAEKEKNKRLREQQFRPANKCISPHCDNFIDVDYCTKCLEDWAS